MMTYEEIIEALRPKNEWGLGKEVYITEETFQKLLKDPQFSLSEGKTFSTLPGNYVGPKEVVFRAWPATIFVVHPMSEALIT